MSWPELGAIATIVVLSALVVAFVWPMVRRR